MATLIEANSHERWQDLESQVARILSECGYEVEVQKNVPLARGDVNIDVWADEHSSPSNIIAVECKHWSTPATKNVVHGFRTVVGDSGANTGLIVSSAGFQEGAVEAAAYSKERERLDADQRERDRQHHADITAIQLPHKRTREGERIYKFKPRNMGSGYSKHVVAWLQTTDGHVLGGLPYGIPLERGHEAPFDVPVPRELWERDRPPLDVVVEWRNDQGERETETSNLKFDYDR